MIPQASSLTRENRQRSNYWVNPQRETPSRGASKQQLYNIMIPDIIPFHSSAFDHKNDQKIRKAAMTTHGSYGPSGLDANEWRRILTHFGQQSVEISKTLAKIAQKISIEILSHELLEPYSACCLIPLDKNPGARPIGIGEVILRIIGKTITKCLKS